MGRLNILSFMITLIFLSCQKDFSPVNEDSKILFAPDKNLPVKEILNRQRIKTIHFTQWDSIVVNDQPAYGYSISWDVYLDSKHIRTTQYLTEGYPWIVTVIDLEKWKVWQYSHTINSYIELAFPDTLVAFETIAKPYITSKLISNLRGDGFEYIDGYYCHVVKDSKANKELIWIKHGFPVQWEITSYPDGIKVKAYRRLHDIEINIDLPDSIFIRP